jgi:hypothetical protein
MSFNQESARGPEAKFAHDEDRRREAAVRRNRLLALWAAETVKMPERHRDAYARDVIRLGLEGGDAPVLARIQADLRAARAAVPDAELDQMMVALLVEAQDQLRMEDLTTPEATPQQH